MDMTASSRWIRDHALSACSVVSRLTSGGGLAVLAFAAIGAVSTAASAMEQQPQPQLLMPSPGVMKLLSDHRRQQLERLEQQLPLKPGEQRFVIGSHRMNTLNQSYPGIEVRVGRTVKTDCNGVQLFGQLQPVEGIQAPNARFWRLQGPHAGDMASTLMLCPQQTRVERQVWLGRSPVLIPGTGQATVVDLPRGWTLQWRPQGAMPDQPWLSAQPLQGSEPVEAHRN
jgi:serine protease inhibitor ecotin